MTRQKSFVQDILRYLPSKLLPALTAFITTPILTRLFVPAEFGDWALASAVIEFCLAFATSSFGAAAIRYWPIYRARSEPGSFFAVLGVSVIAVIAAMSALGWLLLRLLRDLLPGDLYPLLLFTIPIFVVQAIFGVFLSVTRSQERSGLYTVFQLVLRYGSLGLGLLLVIAWDLGVEGLLWGTFVTLLVSTPILLLATTRGINLRQGQFRWADAREMWHYTWPLALGNVAMWGLRLSDRFIIGLFRSSTEVGLYSVAYNVSDKSIDILVALFLLSTSPLLMNAFESEGRDSTEKALSMVTRLYLILCLPAVVGLTILASPFIALLADEAYHDGYRIVGFVALSSFFWGLSTMASMGVMAKKKAMRLGGNQVIAAGVNLALNLALVPLFGFVVAGITTLVGFVLLFVLHAFSSRKHLTWRFPYRTLCNVLIAASLMGLVVWGVYGLSGDWDQANVLYLLLSIGLGLPVYFGCLVVLGEARPGEKVALRRLWHRLAGGVG